MFEILTALGTAAGLLLPILIFMTIASIVAVKRGEGEAPHTHGAPEVLQDGETASAAAAIPRELSVVEILLLAVAVFSAAMLALLGVSMFGHI